VLNPLVPAAAAEALDRALRGEIRDVRTFAVQLRERRGKRR
jgi:hypothetical protein